MRPETVSTLLDLNRQFYQKSAASFAATRRRIQPGIRRILAQIPRQGCWLDLGCGSGALAAECLKQGRSGLYLGLDFSAQLLEGARQAIAGLATPGLTVRFELADLSAPDWAASLDKINWDGILAFAVLHHLPGSELRLNLLRQVRELLGPGGQFIHSEWQFQNSPRLLARRQPWENAGLLASEVDPGDALLDWRAGASDQELGASLRYVHLFNRDELGELAKSSGFEIDQEFEADGQGGHLGLYQVWRAI
jgi:tRNA (uracil-5-)-methyltransferase TRM9